MILNTVLTSTNLHENYIDFIPNFINHWKKLFPEINVVIVLISDHIPDKFLNYKDNIILYANKLNKIPSAFQAMCIRNLYPCILENHGNILISDIDMMPMNRAYYENSIKTASDTKFITYRDVLLPINEYPMCYNIANTNTWKEVFNIKSITDIDNLLNIWYENSNYRIDNPSLTGIHNFDQKILFKSLQEFNQKTSNLVVLNDIICKYRRLDRLKTGSADHVYVRDLFKNDEIRMDIKAGKFSDYHSLRPYNKYKYINNYILNFL